MGYAARARGTFEERKEAAIIRDTELNKRRHEELQAMEDVKSDRRYRKECIITTLLEQMLCVYTKY